MAIGGESTGWAIQLDSDLKIQVRQINSIEVDSHESKKLEKLENKRVKTGNRSILEVLALPAARARPEW